MSCEVFTYCWWIVVSINSKTRNLKAKDFVTRGQRIIKIFHRVIKKLHRRLRHLKRDIRDLRDIIKVSGSIGNIRYILTSGFFLLSNIDNHFINYYTIYYFSYRFVILLYNEVKFLFMKYSSIEVIIFLCMKFCWKVLFRFVCDAFFCICKIVEFVAQI